MGKDIFQEIFEDIDRTLGKFKYKKGQTIDLKNINVVSRDHIVEGWNSESGGEIVKIDYYLAKKSDGSVEIIKAPENIQREIQIVHDEEDKMHWRILGLDGKVYKNKKSCIEENLVLFFIPELDLKSQSIYQFIFGNFLNANFTLYNVKDYDSNYKNKNFIRKNHFRCMQYFSKDFEDFIQVLNQVFNSGKKYYTISTASYSTIIEMLKKKKCITREEHFIKTKIIEFLNKSENWMSILDLFHGWYHKAKNPIKYDSKQYQDPIGYLNYLNLRSSLLKYKKMKNVNLRFLKNIVRKYSFNKELNQEIEKNTEFGLFEKLDIVYNLVQIIMYRKGGFSE